MTMRKKKRKIYHSRKFFRKVFSMRFIEIGSNFYPINDRVIFSKNILPNETHFLLLNYTDRSGGDIVIGDATNYKNLPFEKQIEKVLIGKIKEVKF